jgi:hypothetical protein
LELLKCGISPLIVCGVFPNFQGEMSQPPLSVANGMKDMAVTWCKDKVSNAGNLLCIVIVYLHRLELIKKYFVNTRKKFEHEIYKLILQNHLSLNVLCCAQHTQTSSKSSTITTGRSYGVTNTRCCRYSCMCF